MQTSCSARLVQPFMKFVTAQDADQDLVPRDFWSTNPDARVPLEAAHSMLDLGVERRGDRALGLKLGSTMRFGEGGPFDYAVRSATTLRESVDVATRYCRLLADSFRVWLETWRSYALIRMDDGVSWPKPAGDFAMSAFYTIHLADELPVGSKPECWFPYSAPREIGVYERIFPGVTLRFEAPFFGFAFDRGYERAPMPGADPVLHTVHCDRVEALLAELSAAREAKARVRSIIEQAIRYRGSASVPHIARAMNMSRRTMSRRLEHEGTSFSEELDGVRRELALAAVRDAETPLTEVAFRLGFAHAESFHRAFKRWTGETPLNYRRRASGMV
jgi:AraC-like DNA-binding protein